MGWFVFWATISVATFVGITLMTALVPTTERVSNREMIKTAVWCGICWGFVTLIIYVIVNWS